MLCKLNRLSLTIGSLRDRWDVFALQVIFDLANLFASLDPSFTVGLTTLISQLVQGWPIGGVVIFELDITSNRFQQLAWGDMLSQILVELELLPGQWVNKRRDYFEETPNQERNCTDPALVK